MVVDKSQGISPAPLGQRYVVYKIINLCTTFLLRPLQRTFFVLDMSGRKDGHAAEACTYR